MKIYYKGKSYKTAVALFEDYNIKRSKGFDCVNKKGMTPQEAVYSCTHKDEPKSWVERTFPICYEYNGKYYSTLKIVCDVSKVDYRRLRYLLKKGMTVQEAVEFYHKQINEGKIGTNKKITYQGKTYKFRKNLLNEYGVKASDVYYQINKNNISYEEAFDIVVNRDSSKGITYSKNTHNKEITYRGKTYPSRKNLLSEYGVKANDVYYQMNKNNMTYEEAFDTVLKIKENKQILYDGKTYNTITALFKDYDLNINIALERLNRRKMTPEETVYSFTHIDEPKSWIERTSPNCIECDGKYYLSVDKIATAYNVDESKLEYNISKGMKPGDAIAFLTDDIKPYGHKIEYRGKKYESKKLLLEEYKIKAGNIYSRINNGMSYEEALDDILGFTSNEPEVVESVNEPETIKSDTEFTPTPEIKHIESKSRVTKSNPVAKKPIQSRNITSIKRKKKTFTSKVLSFLKSKIA